MKTYLKNRNLLAYILLIFIILTALLLRTWNASQNQYYENEVISLLAIKGIVSHGFPILKHGVVYYRNLLPHYLVAIPVCLWGTGELATRSISIILSLLLMLLVFIMGRDLYSEYVGLLAVIILAFARLENSYAISLRFYMTFQFFFVLTVFLFYKGFMEEQNKYKFWCIISFLCAVFSHELVIELALIFFLFLLITKSWKWLKDKYLWGGVIVTGLAYYIAILYRPSQNINPVIAGPIKVGAAGGIKLYFFNLLDKMLVHSLPVVVLGLLYLYFKKDKKLLFYYLAWGVGMVFVTLLAPDGGFRFILNLFPLYILLFAYSSVRLTKSIYAACYDPIIRLVGNSKTKKLFFISIVLISFSGLLYRMVKNSDFTIYFARSGLKKTHVFVKDNIQNHDLLISTNAWVTEIYVRLPDYFLRQRYVDGKWGEFEFEVDRKGYGYHMLDSIVELEELMYEQDSKIWLIADGKFNGYTGPELISFINNKFKVVYSDRKEGVKVYLWDNNAVN